MEHKKKIAVLACVGVLALGGCSMGSDDKTKSNGTANESETTPPENGGTTNGTTANSDSMDNMMSYLNAQGIEVSNAQPIDQMDFAAHEGRTFMYQGNTAYLYRLKSNDESMKSLLDSAKKNGTVKVNVDGKEQEYSASVNGDYLFVYQKDADMHDLVTALGNYVPGATTTTPNQGGEKTTPTSGTTTNQDTNKTNGTDEKTDPTSKKEPTPQPNAEEMDD